MSKQITIGQNFRVDAVEYASRANAILGIRDSGKTYTATLIAEQLFECGIPFFAFDPIGRWRFLRSPSAGGGGTGFPVVVLGGAAPDLPLTPEEAPKMIRAAMRGGISMVVDLYDVKLSKKDWRAIVRASIETILYENEALGGGLRHVFLEEASEFIPQHVRDGNTYAAVEKLARMGGNAGVGVTLINQRAEEVNKAVLELCDNLLLHRQRGKRSLISLRKWFEVGNVQPPKEITDAIADLPTGECFAWFKDLGRPVRIKVAKKLSFDPNRREMATAAADPGKRVDVSVFIERMRASIAGKKVPAPPYKGCAAAKPMEKQVNEKEAEALRAENARLTKAVADLEITLSELVEQNRLLMARDREVGAPAPTITLPPLAATPTLDMIYAEVKRRAQSDAGLLRILASKPEIEVKVTRRTIQIDDQNYKGRIAALLANGFYDGGQTNGATRAELKRTGKDMDNRSIGRWLDQLVSDGFMVRDANAYVAVKGMKVNVVGPQQ